MSYQRVEQALASGKLEDINKEDLAAWQAEQVKRLEATSKPQTSVPQDALGQRNVMEQARKDVKNPNDRKLADFHPRKTKLEYSDRSAANSLRDVIGPDPFSDIKYFTNTLFIPDATFYSLLVDEVDNVMIATPKFIDAAAGFHPLLSRLYHGQLFFLRALTALKQEGILASSIEAELDLFLTKLPLESWPVPGPVVNYLTGISTSHSTFYGQGTITPYLPQVVTFGTVPGTMIQNICSRVPHLPLIANQLHNYLAMANQFAATQTNAEIRTLIRFQPAAPSNTNAAQNYLGEVFGQSPFSTTAGTGTAGVFPTTPYDRGTYHSNTSATLRENLASPFSLTPPVSTDRAVKVLLSNVDALLFLTSAYDSNTLGPILAGNITWDTFLLWNNIELWRNLQSMMALYCRHLSASTTLNMLPSAGPVQSHITVNAPTHIDLGAQTGRYLGDIKNHGIVGTLRNLALPASEKIDAMTVPLNFSWITANAGGITRPQGAAANITTTSNNRIGGPYFSKNPEVQKTRTLYPANGYKQTVSSDYHSQTPLRSTIPDA